MTRKEDVLAQAARESGISVPQAAAVDELLTDGATVPFVARYRKERTGGLDETQIRKVRDTLNTIREREHRREFVRAQLETQGVLTQELATALDTASSLAEIEDLYLPYKKKRASRATKALEAGLEPLAQLMYAQEDRSWQRTVGNYICEAYPDSDSVRSGCRDLIASWVSEESSTRRELRLLFQEQSAFETKKRADNERFQEFYSFRRPVNRIQGHRVLGALRAVAQEAVRLTVRPEEEKAIEILDRLHFRGEREVREAIADAYKRLLLPSLENEILGALKQRAEQEAISVFAENLRQILMQPPLGERAVLAIDPGFRTGCKVAVLGPTGTYRANAVIYPVEPHQKTEEAEKIVRDLASRFKVDVIAVGNGTGGRETEKFLRSLGLEDVLIVSVDESGASVYSASEAAGAEFPELDLTVRGAISIGRRLQDPLAELVKIDPQSIGVGQYQHDVDEQALRASLQETVEECVNRVGVHLNQASEQLLQFVSGLSARNAAAIVAERERKPFTNRAQLRKVTGIGPKTFEQAAGFLRIRDGSEPLDATAVHPERYPLARKLLAAAGLTPASTLAEREALRSLDLTRFVSSETGMPTLTDIREELLKPGRDPRAQFQAPEFREDISSMDDLREGMVLPGIVTNITRFGAFVDIGVHQDGLVHVSEIADRFVTDPAQELRLRQQVRVKVVSVEADRKRIGLSIKQAGGG